MQKYCNAKIAILACSSVLHAVGCSPSSFGADDKQQQWDTRLNGIWKVTSYVVDGNNSNMGDLRYVFCDGLVVSAYPESDKFMSAEKVEGTPFGKPEGSDSQPSADEGSQSSGSRELNGSDGNFVSLSVYRATTQENAPDSWISLSTKWEEPEESLLGLYQVDGNTLRIVLGKDRPNSMSPKIEGFTPSSTAPRVLTMVRLTTPEPKGRAVSQE